MPVPLTAEATRKTMNIARSRKAFTLIELLVVIAIIAILAAILFPVFAQAKAAAKKTQDLSNMKQIGTGLMLYINDSDDVYPMGQYNISKNPTDWRGISWQGMTEPYIKSGGNLKNSDGNQVNRGNEGIFAAPGFPKPKQWQGAYAIRQDLAPDGVAPWSTAGYTPKTFSSTSIGAPADKVYIIHRGANATQSASVEGQDWNWVSWDPNEWTWVNWLGMNTDDGTPTNPNPEFKTLKKNWGDCDDMRSGVEPKWDDNICGRSPRYTYTGTSNFTFFDGHAKSYRRSETSHQIQYGKNIFIPGITNNGTDIY